MDLTNTIEPDSTQVNAEDFLSGPRTFRISAVRKGTSEQPVNIDLEEVAGRAYRPSKTMRRVLVSAWGPDASSYVGRRLTLYRDPEVSFGRDKVGGIKISHLSHIDKRLELMLTASKGKRAKHVVEPLVESAPAPILTAQDVTASTDTAALRNWWSSAPNLRTVIEARVSELTALPQSGADVDPNTGVA